jgi:hypothetical protein
MLRRDQGNDRANQQQDRCTFLEGGSSACSPAAPHRRALTGRAGLLRSDPVRDEGASGGGRDDADSRLRMPRRLWNFRFYAERGTLIIHYQNTKSRFSRKRWCSQFETIERGSTLPVSVPDLLSPLVGPLNPSIACTTTPAPNQHRMCHSIGSGGCTGCLTATHHRLVPPRPHRESRPPRGSTFWRGALRSTTP